MLYANHTRLPNKKGLCVWDKKYPLWEEQRDERTKLMKKSFMYYETIVASVLGIVKNKKADTGKHRLHFWRKRGIILFG